MARTLANLDDLTPQWLTETLHREGHLPNGEVTSVEVTSSRAIITSSIAFLDVTYSGGSTDLPTKLFLKFANPDSKLDDLAMLAAWKEEKYYRVLHPRCNPCPSRDVLDVQVDESSQQFHLLMADVSETHFQDQWSSLPAMTVETNQRFFEILATFHAQWWDHPDLPDLADQMPEVNTVVYGLDIESIEACFQPFADAFGEFVSSDRLRLYERILASIPEQRDLRGHKRLTESGHLTIIHEDAHPGNVFFPKNLETHDPFLIDWQSWRVQPGTNDIAYLPILSWYPYRRTSVEHLLVDHYYNKLVEAGVEDYAWEDCWHDYRLSALRMMLKVPLFQRLGVGDNACYQLMERSFLNFESLELEELI
jgi:hypothetical protein